MQRCGSTLQLFAKHMLFISATDRSVHAFRQRPHNEHNEHTAVVDCDLASCAEKALAEKRIVLAMAAGLLALSSATSPSACFDACCATSSCAVWQFDGDTTSACVNKANVVLGAIRDAKEAIVDKPEYVTCYVAETDRIKLICSIRRFMKKMAKSGGKFIKTIGRDEGDEVSELWMDYRHFFSSQKVKEITEEMTAGTFADIHGWETCFNCGGMKNCTGQMFKVCGCADSDSD